MMSVEGKLFLKLAIETITDNSDPKPNQRKTASSGTIPSACSTLPLV